ncbi:hypothetical protein QJS83_07815 [Bdellovibrio sp. 22V]|uniref:hypothetical protein n=1 Tax=Bdellovibrio TaxID=958 RepID=UPI002543CA4A|nr:hypothetical protein [Bdellovibrio sp. 22V]WII73781.1 hypothetical protein QJS83_07815 [Bdellovibrio sp. 22V]
MRALKLSLLFVAGMATSFIATAEKAYGARVTQGRFISNKSIDDSLVRNLSCRNLHVGSIYAAIRPDAFDEKRNLPIVNWPFRSGVATIAGCWALSSTQRMVSYLARYNSHSPRSMDDRVASLLDMVRRASVVPKVGMYYGDDSSNPRTNESTYMAVKLKKYQVFAVEQSNFYESAQSLNGLWNRLLIGYTQNFDDNQKVQRNFRLDIQANQADHFFRVSNVGMVFGGGERLDSRNRETIAQLMRNLDGRRLTLINLRAGRTTQHVVMAKSYQKMSNGMIAIRVYDSNYPYKDSYIYFDNLRADFTAPEVIGRFGIEGTRALGAYIVSEEEREDFEETLLTHYTGQCR